MKLTGYQAVTLNRTRMGVEVKSNTESIKHNILHGRHEHDLALQPVLEDVFGERVVVTLEWQNLRPVPEEWEPVRERFLRECVEEVQKLESADLPCKIQVVRKHSPPLGRTLRLTVTITDTASVGIGSRQVGQGWGLAARRIVKHAEKKASSTDTPFALLYFSFEGQNTVISAARLAWAWDEINSKAPPELCGVLLLEKQSGDDERFSAVGRFREHPPGIDRLPVGDLPQKKPEPIPAHRAWDSFRESLTEFARDEDSAEADELRRVFVVTNCDDPEAGELYERAVVTQSNHGRKMEPGLDALDHPFPCDPDEMLEPLFYPPAR